MNFLKRYQPNYPYTSNYKEKFLLENEYLIDFRKDSLAITKIEIIKNGNFESILLESPNYIIRCVRREDIYHQILNGNFPCSLIKADESIGEVHLNHGYDAATSGLTYRKIEYIELTLGINEKYLEINLALIASKICNEDSIHGVGDPENFRFEFGVLLADLPEALNIEPENRVVLEKYLSKFIAGVK